MERTAGDGSFQVLGSQVLASGGDLDAAFPIPDGFTGIGHQVHHHLLELGAIGFQGRQALLQIEIEGDPLAEAHGQQVPHLAHQVVQVLGFHLQGGLSAVGQKLLGELGGPQHRALRPIQVALERRALHELGLGQVQIAQDGGQQVVEVVGDASRQHSEALQLLGLALGFLGLHGFRDVPGGAHEAAEGAVRILKGDEEGFHDTVALGQVHLFPVGHGVAMLQTAGVVGFEVFRLGPGEEGRQALVGHGLRRQANRSGLGGVHALDQEMAVFELLHPEEIVRGVIHQNLEAAFACGKGLFGACALRDIRGHADDAGQPSAVHHRGQDRIEQTLRDGQDGVAWDSVEGLLQPGHHFGIVLVDIQGVEPHHLTGLQPQIGEAAAFGEQERAIRSQLEDHGGTALQNPAELLGSVPELILGPLEVRDVREGGEDARRLLRALFEQWLGAHGDPADLALRGARNPHDDALHRARLTQGDHGGVLQAREGRAVLPHAPPALVLGRAFPQVFQSQSQDALRSGIGGNDLALGVLVDHPLGHGEEEIPGVGLAFPQGFFGLSPFRDVLVHEDDRAQAAVGFQKREGGGPQAAEAGRLPLEHLLEVVPEGRKGDGTAAPQRLQAIENPVPGQDGIFEQGPGSGWLLAEQLQEGRIAAAMAAFAVQDLDGVGVQRQDAAQGFPFPVQLGLGLMDLRGVSGHGQEAGLVAHSDGSDPEEHPADGAIRALDARGVVPQLPLGLQGGQHAGAVFGMGPEAQLLRGGADHLLPREPGEFQEGLVHVQHRAIRPAGNGGGFRKHPERQAEEGILGLEPFRGTGWIGAGFRKGHGRPWKHRNPISIGGGTPRSKSSGGGRETGDGAAAGRVHGLPGWPGCDGQSGRGAPWPGLDAPGGAFWGWRCRPTPVRMKRGWPPCPWASWTGRAASSLDPPG